MQQAKYKLVTYNSSLTMSGFLFTEISALQATDSGLFQLKAGPYRWLNVSGCAFNLMEALVMSLEGVNV